MVAFTYNGTGRVAEPYSLRRARSRPATSYCTHGSPTSDHIKAFNVAKIYDLRITDRAFHPRYNVELSPASQVLPVTVGMSGGSPSRPRFSNVRPRRTSYRFQALRMSLNAQYATKSSGTQKMTLRCADTRTNMVGTVPVHAGIG